MAALGIVACQSPGRQGAEGARRAAEADQPARAVVRGDWDDVEAAIWTAAGQMEIAVERIEGGGRGEDTLRATLRTVRSEPVTLVARRLSGDAEGTGGQRAEGERIELEAQFGRFPDPDDRARRLVELMERRLGQLQGVGAAPIR
jgi:hypothetical protein